MSFSGTTLDSVAQFPNVDPTTGERDALEPNKTLMQYRKVEKTWAGKYNIGYIFFTSHHKNFSDILNHSMLAAPTEASGKLKVGDRVRIVKWQHNPRLEEHQHH